MLYNQSRVQTLEIQVSCILTSMIQLSSIYILIYSKITFVSLRRHVIDSQRA